MRTVKQDIVIIGGGAAGFFSALSARSKSQNANISILEGSSKVLSKVLISGGGRCNVTHNMLDSKELVKNYPRGHQELLGAFSRFSVKDTIAWFKYRGVELKAESDGRMFPVSNTSRTIADCLLKECARLSIDIVTGCGVRKVDRLESGEFLLSCSNSTNYQCTTLIVATGGGHTGHAIASTLGHRIVAPVPSLFTFQIKSALIKGLSGISFPNVDLNLRVAKKTYKQTGPILITHWGLSGPAIIKLSAWAARALHENQYKAELSLNLFPEQDPNSLYTLLCQIKESNSNKTLKNTKILDIPKRYWQQLLSIQEVPDSCTWANLSGRHLKNLQDSLMNQKFLVSGKGVFKEEFVTAGGVSLKEVDFRSMESKKCPNLFFAGEVLDIDGVTGGFNFQSAWTTGWIAGQNV